MSEYVAQPTMNVMVTVQEKYRGRLDAIAGKLESAGMSISDKFEIGNVIVGEVPQANISKLEAVEGIKSVEAEPRFEAYR